MGSENFHRNQYEEGRGDDESLKKKVRTGMRAVLQNYISREEAGTGRGIGKFDTLIHDRLAEWRVLERSSKIKKFTFYFFGTFFIVPIMLMFGAFNSWLGVASFAIGVFIFSWTLQFLKTITIRAYAPSDTKEAKNGVKKAISDIWFETLYSVKIAYAFGLLLILAWGFFGYFFGENLDQIIASWVNLIINQFGVEISHVDTYFFVTLIFIINFASLAGDYLFWKIFYSREKTTIEE